RARGARGFPGDQFLHVIGYAMEFLRAGNEIHVRQIFEQGFAAGLGHATEKPEHHMRPFPGHAAEHSHFAQRFLIRHVAYAARVQQHHVGFGFMRHAFVPAGNERVRHLFGVALVHLTSIRFDKKFRHDRRKSYTGKCLFATPLPGLAKVLTAAAIYGLNEACLKQSLNHRQLGSSEEAASIKWKNCVTPANIASIRRLGRRRTFSSAERLADAGCIFCRATDGATGFCRTKSITGQTFMRCARLAFAGSFRSRQWAACRSDTLRGTCCCRRSFMIGPAAARRILSSAKASRRTLVSPSPSARSCAIFLPNRRGRAVSLFTTAGPT